MKKYYYATSIFTSVVLVAALLYKVCDGKRSSSKVKGPVKRRNPASRHYPGIYNAGNSCFLNSILQSLSSSDQFFEFLSSPTFLDCEILNPKQALFWRTLYEILTELRTPSPSPRSIDCSSLVRIVTKASNSAYWEQQDAQEFLQLLFSWLCEDGSRAISCSLRNPFNSCLFSPAEPVNGSIIKCNKPADLFETFWLPSPPMKGYYSSQIKCFTCGHEMSMNLTGFSCLTLIIPPNSSSLTLTDCLRYLVRGERVDGYRCDYCILSRLLIKVRERIKRMFKACADPESKENSQKGAEKLLHLEQELVDFIQFHGPKPKNLPKNFNSKELYETKSICFKETFICKAPKLLCLHINRAVYNSAGSSFKDSRHVAFPYQLDLEPFCYQFSSSLKNEIKTEYELCAVVEHLGSVSNGHFQVFRKVRFNNTRKWLCASDDSLRYVSEEYVHSREAYLLFYEIRE